MMFKKKLINDKESLYEFSTYETNMKNEFKHNHYVRCGARHTTFHVEDYGTFKVIEIECPVCHERKSIS